ncbi:MAG: N-acetylmuramoyl-L-alanine amidase, partial [Candidatus Taylorbacteria bacterium]|nr:N-acetylmuramoyl-L-alanine amidase [Candidatus Taylorbacteria bacterium]
MISRQQKRRPPSRFHLLAGVALLVLLVALATSGAVPGLRQLAGLFFAETVTPEDLRGAYGVRPISVLIVPGHDNLAPGTAFDGLYESDINLEMANELASVFKKDTGFNVFVTRQEDGEYQDWFAEYREAERDVITKFIADKRAIFKAAADNGYVERHVAIERSSAPSRVAFDLYTVNKYAIDHDIDLILHVHWNDHGGRRRGQEGKYTGFAIYIPHKDMPNARASLAVAEAVRGRLEEFFATSNMPLEKGGIIEDQELIAVGSNASKEQAAMLVEYGYIYE